MLFMVKPSRWDCTEGKSIVRLNNHNRSGLSFLVFMVPFPDRGSEGGICFVLTTSSDRSRSVVSVRKIEFVASRRPGLNPRS